MGKVISIIGAGLSGLSAAVVLTNNGYKVKIYERAPVLGDYRGQDFQVIRNYGSDEGFVKSLEQYGIKLKNMNPIKKIIKYAPSGRFMEVNSDGEPLFYVVKRGKTRNSIDFELYNLIRKENCEITFARNVPVSEGDIIATGPIIRNVSGFGYTFEGINVDSEAIYFFMDERYAPNGYIYVSPFGNNIASVAAVSFNLNINLRVLLDKFLEENQVMRDMIKGFTKRDVFSGFAYCNFPDSASIKGKLFVGSAAGFVEAARGFGLKYGLLSGCLAAKSIIENVDYDHLWKKEFGAELRESLFRHFLLQGLDNSGYEKLILSEKVEVKNYKKIPDTLADIFNKIALSNELKSWKKNYSLSKLFRN